MAHRECADIKKAPMEQTLLKKIKETAGEKMFTSENRKKLNPKIWNVSCSHFLRRHNMYVCQQEMQPKF